VIGQTTFAGGGTADGNALAFLGNTAYLAVTTGGFFVAERAPLVGAARVDVDDLGPVAVPGQVSGAHQSFIGITPGPGGPLDATVVDETQSGAGSYVMQTDGSSFGPAVLVAPNTFATTTSPDAGNDAVAGYTATVSNGSTSYQGAFVSVVGEGSGGCVTRLTFSKTVQAVHLSNNVVRTSQKPAQCSLRIEVGPSPGGLRDLRSSRFRGASCPLREKRSSARSVLRGGRPRPARRSLLAPSERQTSVARALQFVA
jgi:hypothetical protein